MKGVRGHTAQLQPKTTWTRVEPPPSPPGLRPSDAYACERDKEKYDGGTKGVHARKGIKKKNLSTRGKHVRTDVHGEHFKRGDRCNFGVSLNRSVSNAFSTKIFDFAHETRVGKYS